MKTREIIIRPWTSRTELEAALAEWAKRQDSTVRPMGRLTRTYKMKGEDMHWHIRGRRKGMGTVEVTYLPSSGRLTSLVHENRKGFWAREEYKALAREIEKLLGQSPN